MTLPWEVEPEDLAEALKQVEAPRLIDCRELDEWDICHIDGAQLVPLSRFVEEALRVLGSDLKQRIIVNCHHGVRSMNATRWLRQQGYEGAQSLRGGIDLWAEMIEPEMRRY
jgi:rhodanese-related sulfurtransferase